MNKTSGWERGIAVQNLLVTTPIRAKLVGDNTNKGGKTPTWADKTRANIQTPKRFIGGAILSVNAVFCY
jgi:hypothetical protein